MFKKRSLLTLFRMWPNGQRFVWLPAQAGVPQMQPQQQYMYMNGIPQVQMHPHNLIYQQPRQMALQPMMAAQRLVTAMPQQQYLVQPSARHYNTTIMDGKAYRVDQLFPGAQLQRANAVAVAEAAAEQTAGEEEGRAESEAETSGQAESPGKEDEEAKEAVKRPHEGDREEDSSDSSKKLKSDERDEKQSQASADKPKKPPGKVAIREWNLTDFGKECASGGFTNPLLRAGVEMTVMCYNVLAQGLLEQHLELYRHCPKEVLQWERRFDILRSQIGAFKPTILCLQEIQEDHYASCFQPALTSMGYEGVYCKRTNDKMDGCAIFWQTNSFTQCHERGSVEFVKYNVPGTLCDRDNVGLVVRLQPTRPSHQQQRIVVATTHLLFNPKRGDIKLSQLAMLLAAVDAAASRDGTLSRDRYDPVILCGDLNAHPSTPLYNFLCDGFLKYEGLCGRDVARNDQRGGAGPTLPPRMLQPALGITDMCQRHNLVHQSLNQQQGGQGGVASQHRGAVSPGGESDGGMWTLRHRLPLRSVYRHHIKDRGPEVTMYNSVDAGATLDYIFYSVVNRDHHHRGKAGPERELRLLGYYSLFTAQEVQDCGGLPNGRMPSDHLPLIARFLLQPHVSDRDRRGYHSRGPTRDRFSYSRGRHYHR